MTIQNLATRLWSQPKATVIVGEHSEVCKWFQQEAGCRRVNWDFLHAYLSENVKNETEYFPCIGCKNVWHDEKCIVKRNIKHREVVFCNNIGWTLLDMEI